MTEMKTSIMERTYKINNSDITVKFGNILDSEAEVIASSDGSTIRMGGGGVAQAIRNAGGDIIRDDAQSKLPVSLGDAVITTAGHLKHQKYIFHCITIDYSNDQSCTPQGISNEDIHQYIIGHSINKCFQLMHVIGLSSIAFPSIGAGAAGIPYDKVAKVMSETIAKNLCKTNRKMHVEIYLWDRFGNMNTWDYLPFFEHLSAQEALAKSVYEQKTERLHDENSLQVSMGEMPVPETLSSDVFISYSRKDAEKVKLIREKLEDSGIKCWFDEDGMYSGVSFKKVIVDAIKNTKVVLFMSSEHSNKSRNVISEISIAMEREKKIIPVRLDMSPYSESIEYDIVNHDYVVFDDNIGKGCYDKLLTRIVSTLRM